ncbi:uncharacterized protein LOC133888325 isoform X2 [Phragmites australis]|uniref:uncharacterized protein LOC133888325 isoform X2 n=1 Tax=Phragmites australis TaxID=29695 RepID=UPI002D78BA95|nr:uncharacterized protein LOC133888325 isoform X2 [Phragmites australis]
MDAYHQQRRFAGPGDTPPPPQPPHPSHPNAHWYPAPPPPYPPHPSHPYPPQHHRQWGPPPDIHHQRHPAPLPQQHPYAYQPLPPPMPMQPPPPAPGNPWPPHHAAGQPSPASYPPPPPGQAWTNHSWTQDHGYPGHGNEEDWATKAKAWAAAKSVTENRQVQQHVVSTSRTENHHYGYHDQYQQPAGLPTEVKEPLHPPIPQSSNDYVPFPMAGHHRETKHLLDRGPMVSPAKNFDSFPSTYEQEVSYNYSSAPGNGNAMPQYPSSQAQPFPTASSVQDGFPRAPPSMHVPSVEQPPFGHERQSVDPSDQPLEFNSRKAPDMPVHINYNSSIPAAPSVASNHDVVATSTHSWMPPAVGFLPQAPVPPQAAQMDPSVHAAPLFGAVSGSNYVPPAAFGVGSVTEVFPTDPNTLFSVAEKSKKPPVPNWLREELLKKKSAPLSALAQHSSNLNSMESKDAEQPLRRPDQSDSRSNDSAKSTEDDEADEDEIEAARVAAINQEIKRVLTEVLLKVTDDLFDEIATKVLNEDDSSAESNEPTGIFGSKEPNLGESKTKTSAKVVLSATPTNISSSDRKDSIGLSSPKGALLGLASYDSDDDDEDEGDGEAKIPSSNLSSEANASAANPEEGDKSTLGKRHGNHNEKNSSLGSTSSGEDPKYMNKKFQRSTNAEHEREHIHDTQNGEFPLDAKTFIQPKGAVHKMDDKAHRYAEVDIRNRKTSSGSHAEKYNDVESSHRHLEKSGKEDFLKKVKADHTKELESSTAEKYNNDDKYSMYGNLDKKGSFKEEKGSGKIAKHESDTREPYSRGNSKQDDAKGDRKDFSKDTREGNRDITDRGEGKVKDEKEDGSRQMTKSSSSHSSRRSRSRSRSPRERSRNRKESSSHVRGSVSSDEPSDSVKKRKLHSRKNSVSPSPPKSRNRRISRSPHSKHSHRRHSPYSSANRKRRSRSRTPVKRR